MHANSPAFFREMPKGSLGGNRAGSLPPPKAQPRLPGEAPSCRKPLHQMAALSMSAEGTKTLSTGVKTQRAEQGGRQRCPGGQGIAASHGDAHPGYPNFTLTWSTRGTW